MSSCLSFLLSIGPLAEFRQHACDCIRTDISKYVAEGPPKCAPSPDMGSTSYIPAIQLSYIAIQSEIYGYISRYIWLYSSQLYSKIYLAIQLRAIQPDIPGYIAIYFWLYGYEPYSQIYLTIQLSYIANKQLVEPIWQSALEQAVGYQEDSLTAVYRCTLVIRFNMCVCVVNCPTRQSLLLFIGSLH